MIERLRVVKKNIGGIVSDLKFQVSGFKFNTLTGTRIKSFKLWRKVDGTD